MEEIIVSGGRTVLVVGHNIRQRERICTRMLLLDRGRVVQDGNPASLCNTFFEKVERNIAAQHVAFYITRIPYGGLNHLKCEWAFS